MDESAGQKTDPLHAGHPPERPGPGRLLNVNDDEATRYMVSRILRRAGYEVEEAETGMQALEAARRSPDLIVLDVRLPDISGLDICRTLKSDPSTARIPILQTSATFISAERKAEGLESGADGYLAQPIEPPELIATVRALLRARHAEDALRRSALDWQRTFEALGDAVALVSDQGEVYRLNPAMRELLGHPDSLPACSRCLDALFEGGLKAALDSTADARGRPIREVRRNRRTYRVVIDPLRSAGGGRFVLVASDVSDQKALEQEHLRRAEELSAEARRKDEFLAMLAHELRNPLHAIATANRLQDQLQEGDPNRAELRSAISRQVRHLARLVDDLLDVSRITRGKIELSRTVMDLATCIQNGVDMVRGQAENRRQTLEWIPPPTPMPVQVDGLRFEQALINVLSNAVKYSPVGGSIRVQVESAPGSDDAAFEVRITDQGPGIAPDKLEEIFDLFVQVDPSLARSRGGLGIGLTVARSLVELHGGRLWAESEGPGRGSTFVVRMPRAHAEPDRPSERPPTNPPARSLRILVVEDNMDALFALQTLLQTLGHQVWAEADGRRGLEVARHEELDLALIDIGLPGMDGYEVAMRIVQQPGPHPYLVAVTGYGRDTDRGRAEEAGFGAYLVKPVQSEELERLLGRVSAGAAQR